MSEFKAEAFMTLRGPRKCKSPFQFDLNDGRECTRLESCTGKMRPRIDREATRPGASFSRREVKKMVGGNGFEPLTLSV